MFKPEYLITEALLANVRKIEHLITDMRHQPLPPVVRSRFMREARELSAWSSTSIEGNPLALTDVKKLLKSHPKHLRDSEKEVKNYNAALERLVKQVRAKRLPLSSRSVCVMQKQVAQGLMPAADCGRYRTQPVFVNDPRAGRTIYWPPDAKDVEPLMEDLISFVRAHENDIDPIILAGIFHRQFVLIHPFIDGNGRTARLLTTMLLVRGGFDLFRYFSFEQYYNRNVRKYFENVGARGNYYDLAKSIDFTKWLVYFTDGIIDELLRVKKLFATVESRDARLEKHHRAILRYLQEHGSITDREYSSLTDRAKATRVLDFQKLRELKLIERKGRGRATYYVLGDA